MVNTNNPTWNQTFMYPRIHLEDLRSKVIEVTVWDYDRFGSNEFLGEVLIELANIAFIQHDEEPLWHMLNLHESVGGQLTTVPPICPTPGLMVRTIEMVGGGQEQGLFVVLTSIQYYVYLHHLNRMYKYTVGYNLKKVQFREAVLYCCWLQRLK